MIEIKENISLANSTTFRVGGPARYFSEVKDSSEVAEALAWAKDRQLPVFVLGGGSNVLVSDLGFSGLIIRLKTGEISLLEDKTSLKIDAGAKLAQVVNRTATEGLSGLEWASGIPGSIGGAVYGNAGAFGGNMGQSVTKVTAWDKVENRVVNFSQEECQFDYRSSFFKKNKNFIILSVEIKLAPGEKDVIKKKGLEYITKRLAKQPHQCFGSAGSFFKNPIVKDEKLREKFEASSGVKLKDEKIPAGWLIDQAELTGQKVDGAMVSLEHSNFIINTGSAKAENVIILISLIKQKVRNRFGVELEEEVEYLGF